VKSGSSNCCSTGRIGPIIKISTDMSEPRHRSTIRPRGTDFL
jgi:hypothetical protein